VRGAFVSIIWIIGMLCIPEKNHFDYGTSFIIVLLITIFFSLSELFGHVLERQSALAELICRSMVEKINASAFDSSD